MPRSRVFTTLPPTRSPAAPHEVSREMPRFPSKGSFPASGSPAGRGVAPLPQQHLRGILTRVKKIGLRIAATLLSTTVVIFALAAFKTSRAGYGSAPYTVVHKDGNFELRDYPALTVIETSMNRPGNGADGSFMRLFRFISGENALGEKIPMTTPVFMSGSGTDTTMSFVLPTRLNAVTVPQPLDGGSVKVRELGAGRFAVLRFSGARNPKTEIQALEQLKKWTKSEGLSVQSTPVYAYFDPPWTPGFLRRNEVMLQLQTDRH
jgi:DNA gyrase inhibitor GyrI